MFCYFKLIFDHDCVFQVITADLHVHDLNLLYAYIYMCSGIHYNIVQYLHYVCDLDL